MISSTPSSTYPCSSRFMPATLRKLYFCHPAGSIPTNQRCYLLPATAPVVLVLAPPSSPISASRPSLTCAVVTILSVTACAERGKARHLFWNGDDGLIAHARWLEEQKYVDNIRRAVRVAPGVFQSWSRLPSRLCFGLHLAMSNVERLAD